MPDNSDIARRQRTRIRRRRFGIVGGGVVAPGPYGTQTLSSAWWKRDTLTGNTNGASLTAWTDSSLGGWNLVIDSVAPLWDTATIGGSVATDQASLKAFKNTSFSSLASVTAYTIFVVAKASSFPSTMTVVGTTSVGVAACRVSAGNMFFNVGSANAGKYAYSDTTNAHVFECVYDGTQAGNSTRLVVLQDGVAQTLTFAGTIPASTGAISNGISVGNTQGSSERWQGNTAEVIIFAGTAMGASDRSLARVALGAKYSISVTP